jgi:hypothetical protein
MAASKAGLRWLLQKLKGAVHGSLSLVQIVASRQYARSIPARRIEAKTVSHLVRVPGWLALSSSADNPIII